MKLKISPHGLRFRADVSVADKVFIMIQFPQSLIAPSDPQERGFQQHNFKENAHALKFNYPPSRAMISLDLPC